ncbi:endo-1,4-beta-xylanase [Natronosporangium hydrolyticum]|uniref:Beta-xylanase n=1 Tax=Natronosporangium hydrolyticum TaxID=2811111 RepID=A0A895YG78_9ACTN|nr:endo-1,4-beta-xylanase [Natronosporangium hydrolyticum]QSB16827.1 endo-1,4-beta-xylanase [Natronosporangium hydrolyticum]
MPIVAVLVAAGLTFSASPAHADHTLRHSTDKLVGVAINPSWFSNGTYSNIVASEFSSITAENQMKPDALQPQQGNFQFGTAHQIIDFAQQNNQNVYGHTLLWHSQSPGWMTSQSGQQLLNTLRTHITTVVNELDAVQQWDVVNEILEDNGQFRNSHLMNTGLGQGFVADAFHTARAAGGPNKSYCMNDFNTHSINTKSNAYFNLVQDLLNQGVPIDCFGFQTHLYLGEDLSTMQANMERFANLGLEIWISELDIRINMPASQQELQEQAQMYAQVFQFCLNVPACRGVTSWNLHDGASWIPGTFPGTGAAHLYDENLQPKPAYYAVLETLGGSGGGPGPGPGGGGELRGAGSNRCLDVPDASTQNGTQLQIYDCWGGSNQQWTHTSSGELTVYSGGSERCLDAEGNGTANGTAAIIWTCHGGANQRWNLNSNGSISNVHNGLCLDVSDFGTANGSQVQLWSCSGGSNQQWTLG